MKRLRSLLFGGIEPETIVGLGSSSLEPCPRESSEVPDGLSSVFVRLGAKFPDGHTSVFGVGCASRSARVLEHQSSVNATPAPLLPPSSVRFPSADSNWL